MRARSADVFQSGLQWHFVPLGEEELALDPSKAQQLPPLGELLAGVIAPRGTAAPGPASAGRDPGTASRQSRPDSAAQLASAGAPAAAPPPTVSPKVPLALALAVAEEAAPSPPPPARAPAPSPSRQHGQTQADLPDPETEADLVPETALEPEMRMRSQVVATPPEPAPPPLPQPPAPPGGVAPPPGFDIDIQAPVPVAQAREDHGFGGGSDGTGGGGGGFDYFTSTQLSPTQADHAHAWADALAPGPLHRPSGLGLQPPHAAGPPPPTVSRPPQPQPVRFQAQPPVPRPAAPAPDTALRAPAGPPQAAKRRGNFGFQPAERAARRAKTASLANELRAIFGGAGEEGGAPGFELGLATDLFRKAAAAAAAAAPAPVPVAARPAPPVSLLASSPSSEIYSERALAAIEAAEAAAIEAGQQRRAVAEAEEAEEAAAAAPGGEEDAVLQKEHQLPPLPQEKPEKEGAEGRAVPPGGMAGVRAVALARQAQQSTSSNAGWETDLGSPAPQGPAAAASQPAAEPAAEREVQSRSPSPAPGTAPAAPGFLFSTANGRGVQINAAKLAAARRLLDGDGDGDGGQGDPETSHLAAVVHATEIPESEPQGLPDRVPETPADVSAAAAAFGPGASPFVSLRSGAAVTASDAGMARARRLMDGAGAEGAPPPESPAAAPGPAVTPLAGKTTPELRKVVLNQGAPAARPLQHRAAQALPPRSRLGRPPAAGAAAGGGFKPPAQGPARKGRGFTVPRPVAPRVGAGGGITPASAAAAAGGPNPSTSRSEPPPARPVLHYLKSSALAEARAAVAAAAAAGAAPAPPPGWPASLPLDSLAAAAHVFRDAANASGEGWTVTAECLRRRLLAAGASPALATEAWARNHYRWAVWKLARAEFEAGPAAAGRLLTPEVAEDELRRRYEREHGRGARPLIKAILRHDEPAGALAVLMVASVRSGDGGLDLLELTDGWYWVMARCDAALTQQIRRGRIGPGTKLRLAGARLDGCPPGEPLEAAATAALTLSANGVRPAPPRARLGRPPGHRGTYLPMSSVLPDGGVVPQTLVVVLRRYPQLLWTKLPSGVATFQTPRAQAASARLLEEERSRAAAAAAARVQAAEAARCAGWLAAGKPGGALTAVERLYATMVAAGGDAGDDFAASLNAADRGALERYVEQRQAELAAEVASAAAEALAAEIPAAAGAGSTEVAMLLVGEVAHAGAGAGGAALAAGARPPAVALVTSWRCVEGVAAVKEGEVYAVSGLEPRRNGAAGAPLLLPDACLQLAASERVSWRLVAPSLAALPCCLAGQAMPRAAPGLRGLVAVAAAAAAPGAPPGAAVFDFHGALLKAGPVYEDVHNAAYPHYQWAFLADGSVGGEEGAAGAAFLLAVKLQGPRDAVGWLDAGAEGGAVSLADLELQGRDEGPRVWRAAGGKHSAVASGGGPRANPAALAAAAWARDNPGVFKALQARVEALMAG